jgi:adenosylcobinamide-phosphate synthase
MVFYYLTLSLATLALAVVADLIFGEPRGPFHVAVISGKFSSFIGRRFKKFKKQNRAGWILSLLTILIIIVPLDIFFNFLYSITVIYVLFILIYAIFEKSTFAFTSMRDHIKPIITSLESGKIDEARIFTSRCVRRNVMEIEEPLLISAAIETVAEGITDSFTGSLFYYAIFGIFGAIVYRIVNTLDSTFGYRDKENLKFGRSAAILDTILNYIPARISAGLIKVSAYLMNYNNTQVPLYTVLHSLQSRNAAYSMGAMATTLNIRLEKKGNYIINGKGFQPSLKDLKKALNIFYMSFFIMTVFIVIPIILIGSFFFYSHIYFLFPFRI